MGVLCQKHRLFLPCGVCEFERSVVPKPRVRVKAPTRRISAFQYAMLSLPLSGQRTRLAEFWSPFDMGRRA